MRWLSPLLFLFLLTTVSASLSFYTTGGDTVSGYNITEWFIFYITNDGPGNISSVNITIPYAYNVIEADGPDLWSTETTQYYSWFNTAVPMVGGQSRFFNISAYSLTDGNYTWQVIAKNQTTETYSQVDSTSPDITFISIYPLQVEISGNLSTVLIRWENETVGDWISMHLEGAYYTADIPPLKEGSYTMRVFTNNSVGNAAYSTAEYFEDKTSPWIIFTSPITTIYTTEEIDMVYTVWDSVSPTLYCTYKLDTGTYPAGYLEVGTEYSHRVIVSGEGSHVVYMKCTDLGDNSGETEPIIFNVELPSEYKPPPVVYYPPEKEETVEEDDFEIQASLISLQLEQGQNRSFSIQIFNRKDQNLTLTVNSTVFVKPFLILPLKIDLPSLSVVTLPVSVNVVDNTTRGFYTGEIGIFSNLTSKRVPISLEVVQEIITMLYSSVEIYDGKPIAGGELQVYVKLFNLGESLPEQITVNYTIRPKDDNAPVFVRSEEHSFQDITSYQTNLPLAGLSPEYYVLELSVSASNYTDRSFSAFQIISVSFWDTPFFGFRIGDVLITISLVVIGGIAIWRVLLIIIKVLKERKKANAKYEQDLADLPKAGPDTIFMGKVAETNKGAYMHINELTKHTLICGGTGSGKTVAAMVLVEEALKKGASVTVFDPTLQWAGFATESMDTNMTSKYSEFGIKEAKGFQADIDAIDDPSDSVELTLEKGRIQVIAVNRLDSKALDKFLDAAITKMFEKQWSESDQLKHLLVFDEVHRLLPRYGGSGKAIPMLERAIREFRKWGIGVILVSQVLTDFKAAVRANVSNEIQLRTEFEGDIRRVRSKYGIIFSKNIAKLTVGTGMFQNPEYNRGVPYLIRFRPLLHSTHGIPPESSDKMVSFRKELEQLQNKLKTLEKQGIDIYQSQVELDLAAKNLKKQRFSMVRAYIESIEKRLSEQ